MSDVVVIGAGLAGLSAAEHLCREGLDVVVCEARTEIGGRVATGHFPDGTAVDLGAAYVSHHQLRICALAERLGLEIIATTSPGAPLLVDDDGASQDWGLIEEAMAVMADLDELANGLDPTHPSEFPDGVAWDRMSLAEWLERREPHAGTRAIIERAIDGFFVRSSAEVSVLHALFYSRVNGGLVSLLTDHDEYRFAGGAAQLVKGLARPLADRVRLDDPVLRVVRRGTDLSVHTRNQIHRAPLVVRALPAPISSAISWEPALPAAAAQWAMRTPMCTGYKIFLQYAEPYWHQQGLSGEVIPTSGPVSAVRDASPPDGSSGVIVAFINVASSADWGRWPVQERTSALAERISRWLGVPAPIASLERRWGDVPFIRGEVATPGLNTWAPYGEALREVSGAVIPAGTETASEFTFQMEGALASGERAARHARQLLGMHAGEGESHDAPS